MSQRPDLFITTSSLDREAIRKLNDIFEQGALANAMDIQLRLEGDVLKVQYVGDRVEDIEEIVGRDAKLICERVKSRAGIASSDFLTSTDGRFHLIYRKEAGRALDRKLDVRVNIIPTDAGETICLRLLAEANSTLTLDKIDMSNPCRYQFESLLREKQGVVIVCGPVGSGKTTLLFSLLSELQKMGKNIKTIEDPVEIVLPGIDQMQRSNKLSFAQGIRAMVRQHVHVGLVGEVRDEETAETAFRVGNTGTLIFFTVHADDAARVISRCEDLGIDRQTFAQSVRLIVFTRLIGRLPEDKEYARVEPSEASKNWLEAAGLYDESDRFIEVPESEFQGKVPLFEMFSISPEVRRAITSNRSLKEVMEIATKQPQYESLVECAVRKAREGVTTLSAVQDLVGETTQAIESIRLDKQLYDKGMLTASQQFECVQEWGEIRRSGKVIPLWKVIVDLGYASLEQIIDLLGCDEQAKNRVAHLVERKHLSWDAAARIIETWRKHDFNESLFKLLINAGLVTDEQVYTESLLYFRRGGMPALD